MDVLHAFWQYPSKILNQIELAGFGSFCLWIESSAAFCDLLPIRILNKGKAGRAKKRKGSDKLDYTFRNQELLGFSHNLAHDIIGDRLRYKNFKILSPMISIPDQGPKYPEPSSTLLDYAIYEMTDSQAESKTGLWLISCRQSQKYKTGQISKEFGTRKISDPFGSRIISTLSLPLQEAAPFLLKLARNHIVGIKLGNDMQFWLDLTKFAYMLIKKQQILPVYEYEQSFLSSENQKGCWKPIFYDADRELLVKFAESMPLINKTLGILDENLSADNKKENYFNRDIDSHCPLGKSLNCVEKFIEFILNSIMVNYITQKLPYVHNYFKEKMIFEKVATHIGLDLEIAEFYSKDIKFYLSCELISPINPQKDSKEPTSLIERSQLENEKDSEDRIWSLKFLLHVADRPDLVMPPSKLLVSPESYGVYFNRALKHPQQWILNKFMECANEFEPLLAFVEKAIPNSVEINTRQAYEFITFGSRRFESIGVKVTLPDWWRDETSRPVIGLNLHISKQLKAEINYGSVHPSTSEQDMLSNSLLEEIFEVEWYVAMNTTVIPFIDFEKKFGSVAGLIEVDGQWIEVNSKIHNKLYDFLTSPKLPRYMSITQALKYEMGYEPLTSGLPINTITAAPHLETINQLFHHQTIKIILPPATLIGTLRPYQITGLSWLNFLEKFRIGACLADDMGLGKTVQTIALLLLNSPIGAVSGSNSFIENKQGSIATSLIICPMSILGNWQQEIKKFAPTLRCQIHHGTKRRKDGLFQKLVNANDVIITTYALAKRDLGFIQPIKWRYIIIDEAQKIKNPATKQSKAIKTLEARQKIALTGTPVENRVGDLWSIMDFLNPGFLGNKGQFHQIFAKPIMKHKDPHKIKALRQLIQPFFLRRLKTDKTIIQDLPDKVEIIDYSPMTKEQIRLYETEVTGLFSHVDDVSGITRKGLVLATIVALKQILDDPILLEYKKENKLKKSLGSRRMISQIKKEDYGKSGKMALLIDLLDEILINGESTLIFTQFAQMGKILVEILSNHELYKKYGYDIYFISGATPQHKRVAQIQAFQDRIVPTDASPNSKEHSSSNKYPPAIFVLSLKAGGVGLNLSAANHVIHYDRWWNPAVEMQATDRAYRIGQTRNVFVHKFVSTGTIEERIHSMLNDKKALATQMIQAGEQWITELSTQKLKEIMELSKDYITI